MSCALVLSLKDCAVLVNFKGSDVFLDVVVEYSRSFAKILEPLPNSRSQEVDMKEVPFCGPTILH